MGMNSKIKEKIIEGILLFVHIGIPILIFIVFYLTGFSFEISVLVGIIMFFVIWVIGIMLCEIESQRFYDETGIRL